MRREPWALHPDRALPAEPGVRRIAREVLGATASLPIVSMHGHVGAEVLARNEPFSDPASLLVSPDHYLVRLIVSQATTPGPIRNAGVRSAADLGAGPCGESDPRTVWRRFCAGWKALRGTSTGYWLEHALVTVFDAPCEPSAESADRLFDHISERLASADYRPAALFDAFGIELLATTDSATATLEHHAELSGTALSGRVVPTFRPDALLAVAADGWARELTALSASSGVDTTTYHGYLEALRARRATFITAGARATDHGATNTPIVPLEPGDAATIFDRAVRGEATSAEADVFESHMLFQMAVMSAEDGLVMQFHPGILRDHDRTSAAVHGQNIGYDIPVAAEFTRALRPVLETFGHHERFRLIAFTVDETTYSRELAPLAGAYPALRIGAPWWFLDAPDAMRRFREATTETAGFANFSGFVDDTRAFCSIPARHDLARRIDAGHLARLVAEHRLQLDDAVELAIDLAYRLPYASYPSPIDRGADAVKEATHDN